MARFFTDRHLLGFILAGTGLNEGILGREVQNSLKDDLVKHPEHRRAQWWNMASHYSLSTMMNIMAVRTVLPAAMRTNSTGIILSAAAMLATGGIYGYSKLLTNELTSTNCHETDTVEILPNRTRVSVSTTTCTYRCPDDLHKSWSYTTTRTKKESIPKIEPTKKE
jgi:hypothetical protein